MLHRITLQRLLLVALLCLCTPAMAVVHIGPTCAYTSIQAALDANPIETNFHVDAGIYPGFVRLPSPPAHRIWIEGGFHDCQDNQTIDPALTIVSASATDHSVFELGGTFDVTLVNMTLTGGSNVGGGGIQAAGNGFLVLDGIHISGNTATYGGGIQGLGVDGPLMITLASNTLISGNVAAKRGGGVFLSGATRLYMHATQSAITYNRVVGETDNDGGGGLSVVGPARADIGTGGFLNHATDSHYGAVSNNVARSGAGIDVRSGGVVRLYSAEANPLSISYNHGDEFSNSHGGGIYAADANTRVCAWNVRIEGNTSSNGAALSAMGATVDMTRAGAIDGCGPEPATDLGALECKSGHLCNHIVDNPGSAVIELVNPAEWNAERIEVRRNGNPAWYERLINSSATRVALKNCVIADNFPGTTLIWVHQLFIDSCTITRNGLSTQTGYVFNQLTDAELVLAHSIVTTAPGVDFFDRQNPAGLTVIDVIASDTTQLAAGEHDNVIVADPAFTDAAAGDYHLRPDSPAIDYSAAGQPVDAEGHPRGVAASAAGAAHPFDIGAFESDRLFEDGFER
ncbi:MAG: hypothetical protein ACTHK2_10555 [Dokdonella sp.]|uniref:hypothetical protein n=1 Tax=Dokdonella sp. TaxID=2291710 RepID=UPI003F801529